jgi:hypothetical protein
VDLQAATESLQPVRHVLQSGTSLGAVQVETGAVVGDREPQPVSVLLEPD